MNLNDIFVTVKNADGTRRLAGVQDFSFPDFGVPPYVIPKNHLKAVDRCLDASCLTRTDGIELYTKWEIEFLENISKKLTISLKQKDIITRLYNQAIEANY